MNIWKHFKSQPFIVLVALAALPHTVWTIGTYTAGLQPDAFGDWSNLIRAVAWLFPPLMFGIAFDIGQVVTAGEIRNGNRSQWLVRTFYALAVFSYISQLLYAMHHYPKMGIGEGAAPIVTTVGSIISQIAVFVLPALLPVAQVLYTMAYHQPAPELIKCFSCGTTKDVQPSWDGKSDPLCSTCGQRFIDELRADEPELFVEQPDQDFLPLRQPNGHKHAKSDVTV